MSKIFKSIKEKINNFIVWLDTPREEATEKCKIKVMLDEGAKMPTKAHEADAGFDLYARGTQIVSARERAFFDTGVHIELPPSTRGEIKSRSGLYRKHGISTDGTIDVGYTGSIGVTLLNNSGYDYVVKEGDKIAQLVISPILAPELEMVDSLEDTERGNNGFGSSGR